MKHIITAILLILLLPAAAYAEETLTSPDGSIVISFSAENEITYSVTKDNIPVITSSKLGIAFEDADLTSDVRLVSRRDSVIDESYTMMSGKAAVYENRANEAVFTVEKYGSTLDIYMRAYNDGIAVRYGYDRDTRALREATSFNFGHDCNAWAMEYERCYENLYKPGTLGALSGIYGMPLTVQTGGTYVMLTEAGLDGSYAGSVLRSNGYELRVEYEPKQTEPVSITAPFLSPWRAAVIGDLNTVVTTQMPENLSEPCRLYDTSWIKSGVSAWTWFNGDSTSDPLTYKRYIDFAAEMGWQYVLLDEGWQPLLSNENGQRSYSGVYPWVNEVISYAQERGIGLIVWAPYWDLDTAKKRERLAEWADMGIKGVKVDFFDSETQETLKLYDAITEETARLHLLVSYHGTNKPTGERRTWPHILTREAVQGTEHFHSGGDWGPTAEHNCILPYTRNAVGAMDYTPAINDYDGKSYFTAGQKAALPIVFESGIQCLSDKPENYRGSPLYELFKSLPAAWDETRLLSGEIGGSTAMLRRSGENFYIGMITNDERAEDIAIDFLESGKVYRMDIYRDGTNGIIAEHETVKNGDIITIPELYHGGAAIKISPANGSELQDISGHWSERLIRGLLLKDRLNGYFGAELKPDQSITRGEFIMLMCGALGIEVRADSSGFADANLSRAKNHIAAAVRLGILNGVSEYEFAPDAFLTREQTATVIGRYMGYAGGISLGFSDSFDVSDYAKMYVSECERRGIIKGYEDGTFRPQSRITRAEAAAILARIGE